MPTAEIPASKFGMPVVGKSSAATVYAMDGFGFAVPMMILIFAGFLWRYHLKTTAAGAGLDP